MKKGSYQQDDGLKRGNKERLGKQQKKQGIGFLENAIAHESNIPEKSKEGKKKKKRKVG